MRLAAGQASVEGVCGLVRGEEHFARVVGAIAEAKVGVDVMTADLKAMLVPDGRGGARSVIDLFRRLGRRGVEVRVLHAGVPSSSALAELRKGLPAGVTLRRCPRLHAKTVIIDTRAMYLGSANLTGAGLGAKGASRRNFEIGLWTESPTMIDAVLADFNRLWEGRECGRCGRRDVCPVPLEEPGAIFAGG